MIHAHVEAARNINSVADAELVCCTNKKRRTDKLVRRYLTVHRFSF